MSEAGSVWRLDTIETGYRRARRAFRSVGLPTPDLDARVILCAIAGIRHEDMVRSPGIEMAPEASHRLDEAIKRRLAREPVSRIVGRREFHGQDFLLSSATLDPRPDSEVLVERAIAFVRGLDRPPTVLDLGTGSGCLLLSVLLSCPGAEGIGVDLVPEAAATAFTNASQLGVQDRAWFVCGMWTDAIGGRFDCVLANPPYIPSGDIDRLEPEVSRYDPPGALDGGMDGLDAYRALVCCLPGVLRPGGRVFLEIGEGQADAVEDLLETGGFRANGRESDLSGLIRVIVAELPRSRS